MNELEAIAEQVLVLRCRVGDRRALEELYLRHRRRLHYYLSGMLRDEEAARDVQQEVWLRVVREIARLKHAEAFKVWLYRIARSRAMDRMGERRVEPMPEGALGEVVDETTDRPGEGFSAEDAAGIHAALGKLSEDHREVLMLRFMEDLSYEEMAEVIGCGVGTVRSRLFYAKQSLRRGLEKDYERARDEDAA